MQLNMRRFCSRFCAFCIVESIGRKNKVFTKNQFLDKDCVIFVFVFFWFLCFCLCFYHKFYVFYTWVLARKLKCFQNNLFSSKDCSKIPSIKNGNLEISIEKTKCSSKKSVFNNDRVEFGTCFFFFFKFCVFCTVKIIGSKNQVFTKKSVFRAKSVLILMRIFCFSCRFCIFSIRGSIDWKNKMFSKKNQSSVNDCVDLATDSLLLF